MTQATNETLMHECFALLEANEVALNDPSRHIITFFFNTDRHVALRDIEDHLREAGKPLDLEEAQQTMQLLVNYGFASQRRFPDGRVRYEHLHLNEHHDHLYCLRCGSIIEFASPQIEQLQKEIVRQHRFHAFTHRLLIRGLCDGCFSSSSLRHVALAALQSGGRFRVIGVEQTGQHGGWGHGGGAKRLADLGIVAGVEGEVLSNYGIGMMVVQVGGARLALGHGQTRRIIVELLN